MDTNLPHYKFDTASLMFLARVVNDTGLPHSFTEKGKVYNNLGTKLVGYIQSLYLQQKGGFASAAFSPARSDAKWRVEPIEIVASFKSHGIVARQAAFGVAENALYIGEDVVCLPGSTMGFEHSLLKASVAQWLVESRVADLVAVGERYVKELKKEIPVPPPLTQQQMLKLQFRI